MFGKTMLALMIAMGFVVRAPSARMIAEEHRNSIRQRISGASLRTETELPAEYVGRFLIPRVGVDVACYESSAQSVADARDSAAYFYACGHRVIADHVNQGFDAIKGCREGDTAQLVTEQGAEELICVAVIQGHNTGSALTDENYTPINAMYPDALVCYTCNDNWQNVTIVFFVPQEHEEAAEESTTRLQTWDDGTVVAIGPTYSDK